MDNNTQTKITRTIAHVKSGCCFGQQNCIAGLTPIAQHVGELSHSLPRNKVCGRVFRLRHTFSPYNMYIATQGTTQNLMFSETGFCANTFATKNVVELIPTYMSGDYTTTNTATNLRKYQWDYIHDPKNIVGVFEGDGEGQSSTDLVTPIISAIRNNTVNGETTINLSDYYTTDNDAGINMPDWRHLDFGGENKFDVSMKIKTLKPEKNELKIASYSEREFNRKYGTVDGMCTTFEFEYKNRSGIGLELAVPVAQKDKFKDYLFAALIEVISEKADSAIDAGKGMNPGGVACNLTVRAYLHYLKNDNILFPVSHNGTSTWGAPLCCPTTNSQGETVYAPESIFIGSVEWDGRANNIYSSLQNNKLSASFEKIEKESNQTWKNFFDDIQKKANEGEVIIGVKHNLNDSSSGHIVVFMPDNDSYQEKTEMIIGGDIGVKKPYALEAGNPDDNEKKIKQFIGTNSEITRTTRPYIYYRYIK